MFVREEWHNWGLSGWWMGLFREYIGAEIRYREGCHEVVSHRGEMAVIIRIKRVVTDVREENIRRGTRAAIGQKGLIF
jgi:hypothetical protein